MDTAIIALPSTMNGRNLPNLVLVLSIIAPIMGSVIASNTRITVTITEAYSPSCKMFEPNCATKLRIRTKYTLVAPLFIGKSAS